MELQRLDGPGVETFLFVVSSLFHWRAKIDKVACKSKRAFFRTASVCRKEALFPGGMQIGREFAYGAGAVRNLVFLFGGHLGEGLVVSVGYEQRIVPETFVPLFAVDDAPFDHTFEKMFFAVEDQRNDRSELRPAVGRSFEVFSSRRLLAAKSCPSVA